MTTKRVRIISIIIISYMVLALGWWTLLLYNKNEDIYTYQRILSGEQVTEALPDPDTLRSKYLRQKYMIIGEGLFFALSLIIGIGIIYRAIKDEFKVAQLKSNFLLSVTHELKTPISSIKMVLQTLLNKPGLDIEKKQLISRNALQESNRLESMVNKLLLSTKIEDQYLYNFEPIDIHSFVSQIIQFYPKGAIDDKINFSCPNNLTADIDQETFRSLILNLLENAIKYSPPPADISLEINDSNGNLILHVKDKGIGISDDEKEQVVGKFYRIGNEEFRSSTGSGLGLFIVNSIVKSYEGDIEILDNKPKGTVVSIRLPLNQKVK
jgi:signal transduction histidine kinase